MDLVNNIDKELDYLYNLGRFGIEPGLERITALLSQLGNPQRDYRAVHITGTNGKGSIAVMIESALRAGGNKTGLYTSPHIYKFNERIQVLGNEIDDEELVELISLVRKAATEAKVKPTFFEFTTALALLYFSRKKVELAVVEVGMGGLLDATNVVEPIVSVITNVDLDHTEFLGNTALEIAREKAGIIKRGVPVVVGELDDEVMNYVAEVAQEMQAQVVLSKDSSRVASAESPLRGKHQEENTVIALSALETTGLAYDLAGWQDLKWEGRLDVVSTEPFVLVDGAHNEAAFQALYDFITHSKSGMPSYDVLVVGLREGKTAQVLTKKIAPLFKKVITTEGVYRPMPAEELARTLTSRPSPRQHGAQALSRRGEQRIETIVDPREAIKKALKLVGSNGSILVTGSLYMIPEALSYLREKERVSPIIP